MKNLGFEPYKSAKWGPIHHQTGKGGGRLDPKQAQEWAGRHLNTDVDYADVDIEVIHSGGRRPSGAIRRRIRNWKARFFRGLSYIPAILIVVMFSMLAYMS